MQHNLENPFVILLVESVAMQTSVMWDKEDYFSEIQRIQRVEKIFLELKSVRNSLPLCQYGFQAIGCRVLESRINFFPRIWFYKMKLESNLLLCLRK